MYYFFLKILKRNHTLSVQKQCLGCLWGDQRSSEVSPCRQCSFIGFSALLCAQSLPVRWIAEIVNQILMTFLCISNVFQMYFMYFMILNEVYWNLLQHIHDCLGSPNWYQSQNVLAAPRFTNHLVEYRRIKADVNVYICFISIGISIFSQIYTKFVLNI
jgi:hypothetical protein